MLDGVPPQLHRQQVEKPWSRSVEWSTASWALVGPNTRWITAAEAAVVEQCASELVNLAMDYASGRAIVVNTPGLFASYRARYTCQYRFHMLYLEEKDLLREGINRLIIEMVSARQSVPLEERELQPRVAARAEIARLYTPESPQLCACSVGVPFSICSRGRLAAAEASGFCYMCGFLPHYPYCTCARQL